MKKVYIPTKEELEKLQIMRVSYKYILAKVIETLVIEDVIYEEEDMFESAYENLYEFPEIIYAIGRMYPERIKDSENARRDIRLCQKLLEEIPRYDESIYQLDNLIYFEQKPEILCNKEVIDNATKLLSEKLPLHPKYRFSYKEPNILLDDIFSCELDLSSVGVKSYDDLMTIDPIYAIKLGLDSKEKQRELDINTPFIMNRSILKYANRYGIGNSVLTNRNRINKLVKRLEYYKKKYE